MTLTAFRLSAVFWTPFFLADCVNHFWPDCGVVLDGYSFNFAGQRLAWIVGIVMLGRFLLSAFLGTAPGARFQARFEADSAGVYVRPPEYKSRMRWIIPLVIAVAICLPVCRH